MAISMFVGHDRQAEATFHQEFIAGIRIQAISPTHFSPVTRTLFLSHKIVVTTPTTTQLNLMLSVSPNRVTTTTLTTITTSLS